MKVMIRRIYILGFIFALLAGLNTFLGHQYLETQLRAEIKRNMTFKLDYIIEEITSDLDQVENLLQTADTIIRMEEDETKLRWFFQEILNQNSSYLSIYLSTPENKTIYANGWVPPPDLDARTRPWYQAAIKDGKPIITSPYLDVVEERLVITMAQPVYGRDRELLGVVGVDKSLQGMLELLEQEKASENGYSLLFDQDGNVIMSPCPAYDASQPKTIVDIFDVKDHSIWREPSGLVYASLHGLEAGYLRWQTIDRLGMVVATFAPVSDFIDRQTLTIQLVVMMVLSFFVFLFVFSLFHKKQIIQPIKELDYDIKGISVYDLTYRLPVEEHRYFGSLRHTINLMLEKTQGYCEDIWRQQEELEAAYTQLVANEQQLQAQYDEIMEHEAQMQYLADHDPLTGLFNRRKFAENLRNLLEEGQVGAVFMLDLDDFKNINDTQGHVFGDQVLQFVAKQLRNICPQATAYRFGGDEFLLLLVGEDDPETLHQCIEEIFRNLKETRTIEGKRFHLMVSLGAVRYPADGTTVDDLLIKADIAMHNAKRAGKSRYLFFEGSMADTFSRKIHIERILLETIQAESFRLVYQPVVKASTGEIAYFEALIRIQGNPLSPGKFIPIAEESNLILPIGRWVIKEAIRQLLTWKKSGVKVKPIALNFSAKQFYDEDLVDFLAMQLNEEGVDPALIEIEITESVFIDNLEEVTRIIERIKTLGVRIALDDFGTGYSSLNYITRIPVDRIKLDRRFVERLTENILVMKGLIAIAHGLKMDVVGEGVEKSEEARLLREVGCDYFQGYLLSIPLPPDQVERIMDTNYGDLLGYL